MVVLIVAAALTLMLVAGVVMSRRDAGPALEGALRGDPTGSPAPDFELRTLSGKPVRLSDYRGKAVLLNFWATWCAPCRIEMPWLVDLQAQHREHGFEVLGIAMEDTASETIQAFADEMKVNYTILRGRNAVGDAYNVHGLPTTFYIDRAGRISGVSRGLVRRAELEKKIDVIIASSADDAQHAHDHDHAEGDAHDHEH
jgi:peroxiredoxin